MNTVQKIAVLSKNAHSGLNTIYKISAASTMTAYNINLFHLFDGGSEAELMIYSLYLSKYTKSPANCRAVSFVNCRPKIRYSFYVG